MQNNVPPDKKNVIWNKFGQKRDDVCVKLLVSLLVIRILPLFNYVDAIVLVLMNLTADGFGSEHF